MRSRQVLVITSSTAFLPIKETPCLILALRQLTSAGTDSDCAIAVSADLAGRAQELLRSEKGEINFLLCQPELPSSLAHVLAGVLGNADAVVLHDASRPLTSKAQFREAISAFSNSVDAVRPAMPFTETLKILGSNSIIVETLDRSSVLRIGTPELIRVSAIDFEGPDCGWFLPLKKGVRTVHTEGRPEGTRISTSADLRLLELLQN